MEGIFFVDDKMISEVELKKTKLKNYLKVVKTKIESTYGVVVVDNTASNALAFFNALEDDVEKFVQNN